MEIIFIRHNLGIAEETLDKLMAAKLVAIHFANISSTDPADYKSTAAKRALRFLWKSCRLGAIVGADYGKSILIGKIKTGEKIKPIKFYDKKRNKLIFKTVKLRNVKKVSDADLLFLRAIQPRRTTITGWPKAKARLFSILYNEKIPCEVRSFNPSQLEIMCYEYLKMKKIIEVLLMPIGRSLQDVDIFGLGRSKIVIAQVTQSDNTDTVVEKMQKLLQYRSTLSKYFFGPKQPNVKLKGVTYIPIEDVLKSLRTSSNPRYNKMIDIMLGYKT